MSKHPSHYATESLMRTWFYMMSGHANHYTTEDCPMWHVNMVFVLMCGHYWLMLVFCIIEVFRPGILEMANICKIQAWTKNEGSESEWSDHWSWARPRIMLRWVTICYPCILIFLLFMTSRNINQIRQICQLSRYFRKPQIAPTYTYLNTNC